MKQFAGFKSEASASGAYEMLPAGAYVAQIKNVRIDGTEPDQSLVLRVDVTEGEYAGYFTNRYKHDAGNTNSKYPAKYKGDFRLRIPNPDNKKAQYPESDLRRFNDAIWRIEQSNPGFHWQWVEGNLAGLQIGISMQEGEYNGMPYTTIGRLETVDDVRQGKVKPMKPRKPRSDAGITDVSTETTTPAGAQAVDDIEIPF